MPDPVVFLHVAVPVPLRRNFDYLPPVDAPPEQIAGLAPKLLHLAGIGFPGRIARKTLLAGFEELLRPAVIQALGDPLPPAQLGDALFTSQAFQNNADLLLSGILASCCPADIAYGLLRTAFFGVTFCHRRSSWG